VKYQTDIIKNMKKVTIIFIIIVILIGIVYVFKTVNMNTSLNAKDFMSGYLNSNNAVLIDVRTPAEYNAGHIPNSINIDYYSKDFTDKIKKLDKNKDYYIYCRSGSRSGKALIIMKNNDIMKVYDLKGGISSSPQLLK